MKRTKMILVAMAFVFGITMPAVAESEVSVEADVVSSYVWRGAKAGNASVQPSLTYSNGGFSLGAWGSTGFNDLTKEVDFSASYEIGAFTFMVTDYWWNGEGANDYFDYTNAHFFEGSVGVSLDKFSLSVNTMFAGKSDLNSEAKQAYSTYIEGAYEFSVKDVDLSLALGFTPSDGMYADAFNVVNISLTGSKSVKITDSFSLPISGGVILNPYAEDIHFVVGISF